MKFLSEKMETRAEFVDFKEQSEHILNPRDVEASECLSKLKGKESFLAENMMDEPDFMHPTMDMV